MCEVEKIFAAYTREKAKRQAGHTGAFWLSNAAFKIKAYDYIQ